MNQIFMDITLGAVGAQWLSIRVLVLVQPRKAHHFITERLLMGREESHKQTIIRC